MSDLVGNPEDRFSHNEALIISSRTVRNKYFGKTFRKIRWDCKFSTKKNKKNSFLVVISDLKADIEQPHSFFKA